MPETVGVDFLLKADTNTIGGRELVEFANSSNSEYLSRQPSLLSLSTDISVDVDASAFYSTGNASTKLVDAWDSTSGSIDVDIALPNAATSFESTFVVSTIDFPAPTDDATEATFTLESTGTITETIDPALGSGLNTLLTNIFQPDPSSLTADFTTTETGNVEFTGPVFPSSVEITIPVEGSEDGVNTSVTLDAAGALTIQETP